MEFRTNIHPAYQKCLIKPSKYNPSRRKMEFPKLKKSIAENGVLVPILVTSDFFIIDGEHRHRYCTGSTIPCIEYVDYTEKDIPLLIHKLGSSTKPYRQGHSAELYINHRDMFTGQDDKAIRDYDKIYTLFGEDFFRFVAFGLRTVTTDVAKVFRAFWGCWSVIGMWNKVIANKKNLTPPELIQFYGTIFVIQNTLQADARTPVALDRTLSGCKDAFQDFARKCDSGRIDVNYYPIITKHDDGSWNWLPFQPYHRLGVLPCDTVDDTLDQLQNSK